MNVRERRLRQGDKVGVGKSGIGSNFFFFFTGEELPEKGGSPRENLENFMGYCYGSMLKTLKCLQRYH